MVTGFSDSCFILFVFILEWGTSSSMLYSKYRAMVTLSLLLTITK